MLLGSVQLHAVTVELGIERSPDDTFSIDVANAGSMNPGKGDLTPIAAGFFHWNATPNSTPLTGGSSPIGSIRSETVRELARRCRVPVLAAASGSTTGDGNGGKQAGRRQGAQGRGEEADAIKNKLGGATAWTKRSRTSGEFMAVKKPARKTKAAKKFKGVRREK